jgi:hypothetical protein
MEPKQTPAVQRLFSVLKDGSYVAFNDLYSADLRLDLKDLKIISMDIFSGTDENRSYLASLRTDPGSEISEPLDVFAVICEDRNGSVSDAELRLFPLSEEETSIELTLKKHLDQLPVNQQIPMTARWHSALFREIGIEKEIEQDVEDLPPYQYDGNEVTLGSCFETAGLKIIDAGVRDNIPSISGGWEDAQLHALMTQFADESLDRKQWIVHLLYLSESSSRGLLGVMFDTGIRDANHLPRQGVAVFLGAIEGHPAGRARKSLQTAVHELGHALNLAHRFEREVGRADSLSFMNYDWRYMGGNHIKAYWNNFSFTFDRDEISFMRHGPWNKIIPGGDEFHTVKYWYEGTGGYFPYAPERTLPGLELRLGPPASGPLFGFGTPVFLTVTLVNKTKEALNIPPFYLDPKSGILEILIRREAGSAGGGAEMKFKPVISRCFDISEFKGDLLDPGKSMVNNLNLTFGSSGFAFAEPGNYEITAVLSLFHDNNNYVAKSKPLKIRIEYPKTREEELDALEIFTQDVGYYFALGGSDLLTGAEERLEAIKSKRLGKVKDIRDPLSAYITRCQAINSSREFITYADQKYRRREPVPSRVLELFTQLKAYENEIFDRFTLQGNLTLAEKMNKMIE